MVWKKCLCCVIICLLMSGCSGTSRKPTQQALDLRTELMEAGGCSFNAQIDADLGDRVYQFAVTCDYVTGEGAKVEVQQPEEIAGIAASVSDSGSLLEFEGAALDLGIMAGGNVSAMEAAWLLPKCWAEAYVASAGDDGELHRINYLDGYGDGELSVDTWLDSNGTPVHGEIAYDGLRCLTLEITEFQLKQ